MYWLAKFINLFIIGIGCLLFFMMLFVPTVYQPIKAVLLILIIGSIIIKALYDWHPFLYIAILYWTIFFVLVGALFILYGFINETPGAFRVGTVYILWPIVFTILICGINSEKIIDRLFHVMLVAIFAISLYGLSYILNSSGWLPDYLFFNVFPGEYQSISLTKGYVETSLRSLSSLIFLIPLIIAALLTWPNNFKLPIHRFWLWLSLVFGIAFVLSGRRVLLLVVIISPFITLFFRTFLPKSHKTVNRRLLYKFFAVITFFLVAIFIYLQTLYNFDFQVFVDKFLDGFRFYTDKGASLRRIQFYALINGWLESPLFGKGLGAVANIIRSQKYPWSYELYYISILFQTGLFGFFAYVSGILWIYWIGIKMICSGNKLGYYILPVLVGLTSFLIASGTNPYIGKFDYIWVLFLPLAIINYWILVERKKL